jgi:hypothetical protein
MFVDPDSLSGIRRCGVVRPRMAHYGPKFFLLNLNNSYLPGYTTSEQPSTADESTNRSMRSKYSSSEIL